MHAAVQAFEMTESQVVNDWISRFLGAVPGDVVRLVNEQESLDVLSHWFDAAAEAYTFQQFMDVVKQ